MTEDEVRRSTQRVELAIGVVLRYGVILSFAVILIGSVLLFADGGSDVTIRLNGPPVRRDPVAIATGITQLGPKDVISLGLLLLIALPITHVAVSVVLFAIERDAAYVAIASFVLAVLVLSIVMGRVE